MENNKIKLSEISIIIPVKDNQKGIENLLSSFFVTQQEANYPKEIIIVDNNSCPPIINPQKDKNNKVKIQLLKCAKKGPAAARNVGAKKAKGNWLLFIDSDCVFTETTLTGYLSVMFGGVAYAGNVLPLRNNNISNYYKKINLLNPLHQEGNKLAPSHVITANCLINKNIFEKINGFNEKFELAAGEDVDLGIRLTKEGNLYYANKSIIKHNFKNNLFDFYQRIYRYGKGLILLKHFHLINVAEIVNKKKPKSFGVTESLLFVIQQIVLKRGMRSYKIKDKD